MKNYDIYAIGNALVDTEYEVSDAQLQAMGIEKRHMTLIDTERRASLLQQVAHLHARQTGGGSAANTVVALAQLGGSAYYSCRVGNDALGTFYRDDLLANGVDTNLQNQTPPPGQTGSCMVMVTPDAERSMSTFLGATAELDASALDEAAIARAKVYYMEGYLAASPTGLAAAMQGRTTARAAGVALGLTLSDMSMINYCRAGLDAMLGDGVDYLFCNEEEAQVWCASQDFDTICTQLAQLAKTVCLTRSAKGCVILHAGQRTEVAGVAVKALDTNGAGDMFAGAFLYAVTQGHNHAHAAWLANLAASTVVAQYGNRLNATAIASLQQRYAQHRG